MMHRFIQEYGMPFHWFSPTSLSSRNVFLVYIWVYLVNLHVCILFFDGVFLVSSLFFHLWHFLNFPC